MAPGAATALAGIAALIAPYTAAHGHGSRFSIVPRRLVGLVGVVWVVFALLAVALVAGV